MSGPRCSVCHQPDAHITTWREVNHEAAMLHDMLHGGGVWIFPGEGFKLPVCADCANPWAASNGHTWTWGGECLTCGMAETDNPSPCRSDDE